jgi:hypothetical protein
MPADTLSDMILGFAVILGTLTLYILSLILRIAKIKKDISHREQPPFILIQYFVNDLL